MADETKPAKKAAAEPKPTPRNTVVVMRGSSPGVKNGDERKVSPEVADFLVENKLARRKSG